MQHALKEDEIFSEQIDKIQILVQNVIENITKQNLDDLVQSEDFVELPQLEGNLANFFEHYLDMMNLLLNIIHFQQTKNWEGYIEPTRKFLQYKKG